MRKIISASMGLVILTAADPVAAQNQTPQAQGYREANRDQMERLDSSAEQFHFMTSQEWARRAAEYRSTTEVHKTNAAQVADLARQGTLPAGIGSRIRDALQSDLELWHQALQVSGRDWKAMRDKWLVPVNSLNDQQWAQQRAAWFAARDAWIDNRLRTNEANRP